MPITFQQVINSPLAVRFVAAAAGALPPAIGYPACDLIGKWIASRRASTLTRAVRLNQWMVRGTDLGKEALDKAVRETLQNNARDLYDLYHVLDRPDVILRRVCPNPLVEELVKRSEFAGRGSNAPNASPSVTGQWPAGGTSRARAGVTETLMTH